MGRRGERRQKEAAAKADRDAQKNLSGKMTISLILKSKRWARRARLHLRGHASHHSDSHTEEDTVRKYTRALYALADAHDYAAVQAFKLMHARLMEQVIAKMSRGMRASNVGRWRRRVRYVAVMAEVSAYFAQEPALTLRIDTSSATSIPPRSSPIATVRHGRSQVDEIKIQNQTRGYQVLLCTGLRTFKSNSTIR